MYLRDGHDISPTFSWFFCRCYHWFCRYFYLILDPVTPEPVTVFWQAKCRGVIGWVLCGEGHIARRRVELFTRRNTLRGESYQRILELEIVAQFWSTSRLDRKSVV